MFDTRSEAIQAVFALLAIAAIAGIVAGTTVAETGREVLGYVGLACGVGLVGIAIGKLTEWLVAAGEVPGLGIDIDAPDNATTGFYAAALAVMVLGLVVEVTVGHPDPEFILLFVAGILLFFVQGFRRDIGSNTTGQ